MFRVIFVIRFSSFIKPLGSKTLNEFTGQRKVNKMEWADTRVRICDDDSEIYEILNKDGSMKKIIVIAPNKTTVAYDPLKRKLM